MTGIDFMRLREPGHESELVAVLNQMLPSIEKELGPDHFDMAAFHDQLGKALHALDRPREAEPAFRKSLRIYEKHLGKSHRQIGVILTRLAETLRAMARYKDAEELYLRVIAIDEALYGPDDAELILDHWNVAILYEDAGQASKSEQSLRKALRICERDPARHQDMIERISNKLAPAAQSRDDSTPSMEEIIRDPKRRAEAEQLFARMIEEGDAELRAHPTFITILQKHAELLVFSRKFDQAEHQYQRALKLNEEHFGKGHQGSVDILRGLGLLNYFRGKRGEAERRFNEALSIVLKNFGPAHPETAKLAAELDGIVKGEVGTLDDMGLPSSSQSASPWTLIGVILAVLAAGAAAWAFYAPQ